MAGPTPDAWTEAWTSGPCDQGEHVLFHAWETGVDLTQVPAANRTTISALSAVQSELASFAAARGITPSSVSTSALISAMTTALQTADAPGRITALAAVSCANGLQPFPGAPACTAAATDAGDAGASTVDASTSTADASTSSADGGSEPSGSGDDSGCSTSAGAKGSSFPLGGAFAWIGALGALGIRRRWRTRASK
jgi:MYXO-CTERM domain-containing protein